MQVTERMQVLGDHAKSSRQPLLKERKRAKADESAAKPDPIDETILENGSTHDGAVAALVDEVTPQVVVQETVERQPVSADGSATQAEAVREDDDTGVAKRAIIHEWQNWSALHSDELDDPKVAEYFFRHLEQKKANLLIFGLQSDLDAVRALIASQLR
jgi:hypothetical protein